MVRLKEKIAEGVVGTVVIGALGAFLFFGADRLLVEPDNAELFLNPKLHLYFSPPCARTGKIDDNHKLPDVLLSTAGEMRARSKSGEKWYADAVCNRVDGFMQKETFWNRVFGQESRWTTAGKWRW